MNLRTPNPGTEATTEQIVPASSVMKDPIVWASLVTLGSLIAVVILLVWRLA